MSRALAISQRQAQTLLRAAEAERAIIEVKVGEVVYRLIPAIHAQAMKPIERIAYVANGSNTRGRSLSSSMTSMTLGLRAIFWAKATTKTCSLTWRRSIGFCATCTCQKTKMLSRLTTRRGLHRLQHDQPHTTRAKLGSVRRE